EIIWHHSDETAPIVFKAQMLRKPARLSGNRARLFQSQQEVTGNEGIVVRVLSGSPDKTAPFVLREFADILNDTENEALLIPRVFVVHRYSFAVIAHVAALGVLSSS